MVRKRWTDAEDAIIRRCYASGSYSPAVDALKLLPHRRTIGTIWQRAMRIGIKRPPLERRVPTVRHDDHPEPPTRHPQGHVRPAMCPNCAHVFTMPADPLAT